MKCGIGVVGHTNTQELLNKIIEEIDVLLAEVCTNLSDINRFDVIKGDLRALFNELQKDIWSLKNEMGVMKNEFCAMRARVSKLETVECDVNVIRMGNLGTQLRNKMIRFIKPELSKRAARDEFLDHLQGRGEVYKSFGIDQTTRSQSDRVWHRSSDQFVEQGTSTKSSPGRFHTVRNSRCDFIRVYLIARWVPGRTGHPCRSIFKTSRGESSWAAHCAFGIKIVNICILQFFCLFSRDFRAE